MKKNKNKSHTQFKSAQSVKLSAAENNKETAGKQRVNESDMLQKPFFSNVSIFVVVVLGFLLCLLAFKNISYPLLWNDESETILTGQQVLKYGYPKVHDGKNTIFIADNPMWLGYDSVKDINTTIPWGSYYFSTIGVWLAHRTTDLYQKTALVRIPFVAVGLIGILIFGFAMRGFFSTSFSFRMFVIAFLLFEILSVNMFLNIREARYYSLVIFVCGCYFYVFAGYQFHRKYSLKIYLIALTIVLLAAYNINFITYVAIAATTGLYQVFAYLNYSRGKPNSVYPSDLKESVLLISPIIISIVMVVPEIVYFQTFKIATLANLYYQNSNVLMVKHLEDIAQCLSRFDLLYAMLIIKVLRAGYAFSVFRSKAALSKGTKRLNAMAFFMAVFFIVYMLVTARLPFIWMRYYVVLQPVLALIILTDVLIILDYAAILQPKKSASRVKYAIIPIAFFICLANVVIMDNHISDYLYQITTPYQGPLDCYIPAIKQKYPRTEDIVIATNYEELSYEYYLGCKVILGYRNQFHDYTESELQKYSPEILIYRPYPPSMQDTKPYDYFATHAQYQKVTFPVRDWPVNNMADLNAFVKHQFRTLYALNENEKANMYVKIKP